jgi:hypothetical protein
MESVAVWLKAAVPGGRAVATEDFEVLFFSFFQLLFFLKHRL